MTRAERSRLRSVPSKWVSLRCASTMVTPTIETPLSTPTGSFPRLLRCRGHVKGAERSKARGTLFGLAFGDALGAPTEFMSYDAIIERYGPRGPHELPARALVTDDTQMTLAVADALLAAVE